jgi:uncharacterized protein YuzE
MLNYNDWIQTNLLEYRSTPEIYTSVDKLVMELEKSLGSLYFIPKLEKFIRIGEPVQTKYLFTPKIGGRTFNINVKEDGKIYSIDFWRKRDIFPTITVYIKNGTIEQIVSFITDIINADNITQQEVENILHTYLKESVNDTELEADVKQPKLIQKHDDEHESLYDYADDPDELFEDFKLYVDMVISGKQPSLVITGSPGLGKTYLVTKQLKDAGIEYTHVKGRSTAAGLYLTLYENKDKMLVIDDCDSIFKSEDAVNILKGALDADYKREVTWATGKALKDKKGNPVPSKFEFTGRMIFISNLPQKKIDKAVKDRSFVLEVALRPKDMMDRMERLLPSTHKEIALSVRNQAFGLIKLEYKYDKYLELSMRTLIKAFKIVNEVDDTSTARRLIRQQCSYK